MITLYTFGPGLGLPDSSPFVMKAEMLLKLANLPYTRKSGGIRKSPKGKLPFINDDGTGIADSTFIRWHIEKKYNIDLDVHLNSEQKAITWALEKMLEDHLYWALVEARWCIEENFERGAKSYFRAIPWPLRPLVETIIRRKIRKSLHAHGMGRHTRKEIEALAIKDVDTIATLLGNKKYLMGDRPCGADATLIAFLAGLFCAQIETPIRQHAEQYPQLLAYRDRLMQEFYPDFVPR